MRHHDRAAAADGTIPDTPAPVAASSDQRGSAQHRSPRGARDRRDSPGVEDPAAARRAAWHRSTITATPAELVRITSLATVLVLAPAVVMGFVSGRLTAPPAAHHAPTRGGIHYEHGLPRGFPPTAQGAGDAAAWYLTLLSARRSAPDGERRALITQLSVPGTRGEAAALVAAADQTPTVTPLRVWATGARHPSLEPDGATVQVQLYEVANPLPGNGRDAVGSRFYLQQAVLQRHHGQWLLRHLLPPSNVAAAGSHSTASTLARVFGRDSWIPYMR